MEVELQKTFGAEEMCSDNYNLLFYRDCFTDKNKHMDV